MAALALAGAAFADELAGAEGGDGADHVGRQLDATREGFGLLDAGELLRREEFLVGQALDLLEHRDHLEAEVALLGGEFVAVIDHDAAAGRQRAVRVTFRDQLDLLLGGALEAFGGLVEVLDHVELAEHDLELVDDLLALRGGFELLLAGVSRDRDGLLEVVEDRLDFGLAQPAEVVGHAAEHLLLGVGGEPLEHHGVQRGGRAAGRLVHAGLDLLLLVPLLGGIDVLGNRQRDHRPDQHQRGHEPASAGGHRRASLRRVGRGERRPGVNSVII